MTDYNDVMLQLDADEATKLLATQTLGRLVERVGDRIEIFPINFVSDGKRLVFRTAPGTKLAGLVAADEIVLETDHVGEKSAWSVVVRGTARILEGEADIARAEQFDLRPLVPTVKRVFVEISVDEITGRRFVLGPEPEAEPETVA
ncbi:MAG: pyridoxamine 5'-phosphate oxidase family protein [Microbacteriaceae bacterium]|nr:pyridoxamine 5'-phosphate oxidase family protein [Microbacteriaceae bacterium]